jgi:hypothetical protein
MANLVAGNVAGGLSAAVLNPIQGEGCRPIDRMPHGPYAGYRRAPCTRSSQCRRVWCC